MPKRWPQRREIPRATTGRAFPASPHVRALVLAAVGLLLLAGAGCRQDMQNQPHFIPLRPSSFWPDNRSARPLVAGTIPRGFLREDTLLYDGMVNGKPATEFPFPVTMEVLARGRQRFNIYCTPCHSYLGNGDGMVPQRGYRHPPSFHTDILRNAPVGHLYDVITRGWGSMPDYREQITPVDRWAIVAYIRALQLSQHATLNDVPAEHRADLNRPVPLPAEVPGKAGLQETQVPTGTGEIH
jgi:hypothetical protein